MKRKPKRRGWHRDWNDWLDAMMGVIAEQETERVEHERARMGGDFEHYSARISMH